MPEISLSTCFPHPVTFSSKKGITKGRSSCHQEMKTGTPMAVQRVEWRKLESYFSTGFRGLEEVRPLPSAVSVPQPDVQGPLRSHERLLFQPDVYSWPPALTDLSPLHPLQSLLTGMSFYCSSSYYIVQISASALSASLISPIQIVVFLWNA